MGMVVVSAPVALCGTITACANLCSKKGREGKGREGSRVYDGYPVGSTPGATKGRVLSEQSTRRSCSVII